MLSSRATASRRLSALSFFGGASSAAMLFCLIFIVTSFAIYGVNSRNIPLTKRAAFYIANGTVCNVDGVIYQNNEKIPTDNPCEVCYCRPPGFACVIRDCELKPHCKAVRKEGQCCPDFYCDGCEHDGELYADGQVIPNTGSPCYTCYCQGSSITCSLVSCTFRNDCAARYNPGECCPRYDHCPPKSFTVPERENEIENNNRTPASGSTSSTTATSRKSESDNEVTDKKTVSAKALPSPTMTAVTAIEGLTESATPAAAAATTVYAPSTLPVTSAQTSGDRFPVRVEDRESSSGTFGIKVNDTSNSPLSSPATHDFLLNDAHTNSPDAAHITAQVTKATQTTQTVPVTEMNFSSANSADTAAPTTTLPTLTSTKRETVTTVSIGDPKTAQSASTSKSDLPSVQLDTKTSTAFTFMGGTTVSAAQGGGIRATTETLAPLAADSAQETLNSVSTTTAAASTAAEFAEEAHTSSPAPDDFSVTEFLTEKPTELVSASTAAPFFTRTLSSTQLDSGLTRSLVDADNSASSFTASPQNSVVPLVTASPDVPIVTTITSPDQVAKTASAEKDASEQKSGNLTQDTSEFTKTIPTTSQTVASGPLQPTVVHVSEDDVDRIDDVTQRLTSVTKAIYQKASTLKPGAIEDWELNEFREAVALLESHYRSLYERTDSSAVKPTLHSLVNRDTERGSKPSNLRTYQGYPILNQDMIDALLAGESPATIFEKYGLASSAVGHTTPMPHSVPMLKTADGLEDLIVPERRPLLGPDGSDGGVKSSDAAQSGDDRGRLPTAAGPDDDPLRILRDSLDVDDARLRNFTLSQNGEDHPTIEAATEDQGLHASAVESLTQEKSDVNRPVTSVDEAEISTTTQSVHLVTGENL